MYALSFLRERTEGGSWRESSVGELAAETGKVFRRKTNPVSRNFMLIFVAETDQESIPGYRNSDHGLGMSSIAEQLPRIQEIRLPMVCDYDS